MIDAGTILSAVGFIASVFLVGLLAKRPARAPVTARIRKKKR